ncbi:MAG TPA: NAD-dependent epimerase/dehydratase family protein [Pseudomonadales bacterium]|nr:NAD-dependent epimerase/dehydratase family protein [Pseudomonadales bacterium]
MLDIYAHIKALRGPILVTGASGFIGANLYKLLSASRDDVFAVVRSERGWRLSDIPDEKIISVDLNDHAATKNLVNSLQPQTVFHCMAYGAYSFEEDNGLIYRTNFQSLVNFVELLASRPFSAFVHAGSSSEYGNNCAAPDESSICEPNSPYAVSKAAAATFLRYMGKTRKFPSVNLRLYAVYGPLEDTSRLIPTLVKSAIEKTLPPFVNGEISRDFVYIDDICNAFIMAASKMQPDFYGESFNIGTGNKTTIRELAETARRVFEIDQPPTFGTMENRAWDLAEWYANPSRANMILNWQAECSLDTGLKKTAEWVASLTENQIHLGTKKNLKNRRRSISAIVACYKDAQAIPVMHKRLTETLKGIGVDYEIIFVNDGSPDNSEAVIRSISDNDPHVLGVTHSRNFGSQMAFRSGMELSTKDSVVLLDGDLQDPPELIASFYTKWQEGADVVYGRRIKREMPWHWGLLYKLFYRIFAMFSYVKIPLDAGDFSLMDRRVVGWLLKCPERDLFVRGLRAYIGFKQEGVDYIRPERMFGTSTNSLFSNIDWAKKGIFSFSNTPLTMLTTSGILLLALSFILATTAALLRIFIPDIAPRGITTVLIGILFFGSFNIFAIGLVGEYVAKIMAEVKGRPRMIRAAITRLGKTTDLLPDGKADESRR